MATKSSYFLAILLIANPFMLVFFQNCSASSKDRVIANDEGENITIEELRNHQEPEFIYKVDKNLIQK